MATPRRTASLSRHTAPSFVLVGGLELIQLRKVGWLARCMFYELLAMADHSTGRVSTSYAVLGALLDFDRTPGAHAAPGATVQRLRTALADLAALRLVTLDPIKNEKAKGLFLKVQSRDGITSANANSNRRSNRPQKPQSQATARVSGPSAQQEQQTEEQGAQEKNSPLTPQLSTDPADVRARLKTARDAMAARGAGGRSRAPKGAGT
jgi:hypothetical protein